MTIRAGGSHMALVSAVRFSLTQPSPAGRGLLGACAIIRLGGSIRRWRPYSVGAPGRAPLPCIAKPGHCRETYIRRSTKKPPLVKGGLGGFYTYTYTYTSPGTAANLLLCAERRRRAGCCWGGGVL